MAEATEIVPPGDEEVDDARGEEGDEGQRLRRRPRRLAGKTHDRQLREFFSLPGTELQNVAASPSRGYWRQSFLGGGGGVVDSASRRGFSARRGDASTGASAIPTHLDRASRPFSAPLP